MKKKKSNPLALYLESRWLLWQDSFSGLIETVYLQKHGGVGEKEMEE